MKNGLVVDSISKEAISYPGFGTPVEGVKRPTSVCRPGQIGIVLVGALFAVALYAGLTIGAHRLLGVGRLADIASVGIGIVGTLGAIYCVKRGVDGYRTSHAHEYCSVLPEDRRVDSGNSPKVGETTLADVVISNVVDEAFAWKLEMVKRAEQSIEWSFNFAGGPEFQRALDAIEERVTKGVTAHLLMSEDLLRPADRARLAALKERHGERFHCLITDRKAVLSCGPWRTEENHVKLLVVDGYYFALGGTGVCPQMTHENQEVGWKPANAGEGTMDPGFRDTDAIGRGAVADTMRRQFFNLYRKWQGRMGELAMAQFREVTPGTRGPWERFDGAAVKGAPVRFVVSGPEHARYNPIDGAIAATLSSTTGPVLIGNCGNHPSPMITAALAAKRVSGAEVAGIFNGTNDWFGQGSTGRKMWAYQSRQQYRTEWFSEVREYDNSHPDAQGQLYHKKVGVVGEAGHRKAWISSQNWSVKSHYYDDEVALFIDDDRAAGKVEEGLREDVRRSNPATLNPSPFSPESWFHTFMMSLLGSLVF